MLAYLPDLLRSDPTDALQATLKAIGLASISQIHNLPALRRAAGEEYSVALRGINRSLQDADTATSDSTLGTVVLLALYEVSPLELWTGCSSFYNCGTRSFHALNQI